MQENLKDILSNLSTEIDQETLLLYLQGKLSPEKQHEVEKKLLNSDFEADAYEGLENFKDREQLQFLAEQLNRDLKKRTLKKQSFREKLKLKNNYWLLTTLLIILLLIILAYLVIYTYIQR